ncbi:MAG TPA: enoyl-CoA hydratase-related protein [Anaerovoracaceae bacterium]|nr:enoyl-CoA hydratase-related protein [Anaerovoracaceae bacterium]
MANSILFEKKENIAVLKINRPERYNALSRTIVEALDRVLDLIRNDYEIRVLIITGEKNFAAGADIEEMAELTPKEAKAFSFSRTFLKLENLEVPTIAAVSGYALGGGLELALACDLRIASEDAKIGFPEINLGIMPGAGGTVRLTKLIGEAKAKELIFLGESLTASEAYQFGIINRVVKDGALMDEALMLAEKLAEKSPNALRNAKKSIANKDKHSSKEAFIHEAEIWSDLFSSNDQKEGMKAFLEKRKPIY